MNIIPKLKISPLPYNDPRIIEAFKANQLVSGPHIELFEKGLASTFNYKFANTTSSGFAALFLALKSLKLERAKVVVPSVSTCHAMTNAVLANGFEVVFCDIDPDHLSLSLASLTELFQQTKIDAIIAPSHFGIPAPIETYKQFGVTVIEDACQAFFTRTCITSSADMMILSFYPTKQFNCIEGGAILHNSTEKAEIIDDLRYYNHQILYDGCTRYNLRMINLNAAFGCLLLKKLHIERDRLLKVRDIYIRGISKKFILVPAQGQTGVIPWRFLIKSKNHYLLESFLTENIQSEIELMSLVGSSDSKSWFNQFRSIPYFGDIQDLEQRLVIEKINIFLDSVIEN